MARFFRVRRPSDSTPKATTKPTKCDLAWAAGLLEGEGYFVIQRPKSGQHKGKNTGNSVGCAMTDLEPLQKLQRFFGGSLRELKRGPLPTGTKPKKTWRWLACGARARGIAMTLYVMLSPRRQTQVRELVSAPTLSQLAA